MYHHGFEKVPPVRRSLYRSTLLLISQIHFVSRESQCSGSTTPMGIPPQLSSLVTSYKKNPSGAPSLIIDRPQTSMETRVNSSTYKKNLSRGIAPLLEEEK